MGNPLLVLTTLRRRAQGRSSLRRVAVDVPAEVPATDAIFLVLRRMRLPLILLVSVFAVSVAGLSLIAGTDAEGNPHHMSVFDSFYVMSYTATTIGFGEIPHEFNIPQRLWVTGSIYATVICWAYTFGSLFSLTQDQALRGAIAAQRFARKVRGIREPFVIIVGYGLSGRQVAQALDRMGRRVVVIDSDPDKIDRLATDQLEFDVPAMAGDARNVGFLGLAGLGRDHCEGVVALTDSDEANLAVIMAVELLRPEIRLVARADVRVMGQRMLDFGAEEVINPYDLYGHYLTLAFKQPVTHQLAQWLMGTPDAEIPVLTQELRDGRWVVAADDQFGEEVANDLSDVGLEVDVIDPNWVEPDIGGAVGFVAGSKDDTINLAMAARARLNNPDIFLSVRQRRLTNAAPVAAFSPDSVFTPSELVARETAARLVSPVYRSFVDFVMHQDDEWSRPVLERLVRETGDHKAPSTKLRISHRKSPALAAYLDAGGQVHLGDLLRDPDDRDQSLGVVPLVHLRDGEATFMPEDDLVLEMHDEILVMGRDEDLDLMTPVLFNDRTVEYLVTGRDLPMTWAGRMLAGALTRSR